MSTAFGRQSGILLHITSLPGPGGIGTLGDEAYAFADFLRASGAKLWQVLPCGPTGYGESPYQSSSVFAGNPLLISAQKLAEEGVLVPEPADLADDADPARVDFEAVRARNRAMLRRAFAQSGERLRADTDAFVRARPWLPDFALFTALKEKFGGVRWTDWPDRALIFREKAALERARKELAEEIRFHEFTQYLFFTQWAALKKYCNGLNIRLFGDMPIYAAEDSADAWTRPDVFQLDRERRPKRVAGVPPDYFSADGQLWGNPLYRWTYLRFFRRYDWWVDRMRAMSAMYDVVRVDHFIGFANYWSVPAGEKTARRGRWVVGPGHHLFDRLKKELPGLDIVAEDLGAVNERVIRLLKNVGYPGMRTLCFGFGGGDDNIHFPANLKENQVVYTGTHDNDTTLGWVRTAPADEVEKAGKILGFEREADAPAAFIRGIYASVCRTCVVPMQDVLALGTEARMNLPGTVGGNWGWRMLPGAASPETAARLKALAAETGRL